MFVRDNLRHTRDTYLYSNWHIYKRAWVLINTFDVPANVVNSHIAEKVVSDLLLQYFNGFEINRYSFTCSLVNIIVNPIPYKNYRLSGVMTVQLNILILKNE